VPSAPTRSAVTRFLVEQLAARIGADAGSVDHDADLMELGVKSIDAVLVSGELEDAFGLEVEPVLLFECRTINRVADRILEMANAR
jgi:acyl carrier protein